MADTWVDLGDYQLPLASIRSNRAQRLRHLQPLHATGRQPSCMCVSPHIPMGVALRLPQRPVYYLYHLHRQDPRRHASTCPHYVDSDLVGPQPSSPAVATADAPVSAVCAPVVSAQPGDADDPVDTPRHLLDALLRRSGLTVWRPEFAGKRTYFTARFRLLEAARNILTTCGLPLSSALFMPPTWDPSRRESINQQWSDFLDQISSAGPGNAEFSIGHVIGVVREIETRPHWTAPRLHLAEHKDAFWLDAVPQLLPPQGEPGTIWFCLLVVEGAPSKARFRVIGAAAQRLSDNWIPAYSEAHVSLVDRLIADHLSFTAPLPTQRSTAWALPDYISFEPDGGRVLYGIRGARRIPRPSDRSAASGSR